MMMQLRAAQVQLLEGTAYGATMQFHGSGDVYLDCESSSNSL
jgi:hypothetical protein